MMENMQDILLDSTNINANAESNRISKYPKKPL